MRRIESGFTLIEVMVAGAIAAVLAGTAFAAISMVQRVSGSSARVAGMTSEARVGLEVMGRDIRNAGDSLDQGIAACLGAPGQFQMNVDGINPCPAILEPHPWRIILARYVWADTNGDGSTYSLADRPRVVGGANLADDARNVVAYEFVPDPNVAGALAMVDRSVNPAQNRQVWLGRIDRIQNPFGFAGVPAVRSVLVDNVMLDDALITDPVATPPQPDPNASFSLFMYQFAYRQNEIVNGEARPTVTNTLISPPMRFYPVGAPVAFAQLIAANPPSGIPYAGGYPAEVVGFLPAGTQQGAILAPAANQGGTVTGNDAGSDVRYLIDRNRFRAVRVAFKIHEGRDPSTGGLPREDLQFTGGLDVDGDPSNGTARFTSFQATFEIKTLGLNALQYEQGVAL